MPDRRCVGSLRRRKQLGVIGAPTGGRIPLGLNLPATPDDPRVVATPGMMCSHRVDLRSADEVDVALTGWLAQAYDKAG